MKLEDMILVSTDDHICEPAEMFDVHLPAKFRNSPDAPHVVSSLIGQNWIVEGRRIASTGLNAVVGRPREEYGNEPTSIEQVRAGTYNVKARVDDMNVNGVLGSLCFPTFPGTSGGKLIGMKDKDLALACIRAYNDWHIHEWCGQAPGRFIPMAMLPLWDMDLTVAEVKRCSALGFNAITFPDNPAKAGLPSIHNEFWEPFWKACSEHSMVLNTHIGGATAHTAHASSESPIDAWITAMPMSIAASVSDWLFAGFWQRYANLRIAISEGGIGWIPYLLERADFTYKMHSAWTRSGKNTGGRLPSQVFADHFMTCFIDDKFGVANRNSANLNSITWECDYPHADCAWPNSPEVLWESVKDLTDEDINKITHLNVMREFNYDPISLLGRENCTVGALREQSKHIDTTPISMGGLNPHYDFDRPVNSGDVMRVMAQVEAD